jgi:hypothetical protein
MAGSANPVDGTGVGDGVAGGHAGQVTDGADVSAARRGFAEDVLGGHAQLLTDPRVGGGPDAGPAANVHEQVEIDAGRPGRCSVAEVGADAFAGWRGHRRSGGVRPQGTDHCQFHTPPFRDRDHLS